MMSDRCGGQQKNVIFVSMFTKFRYTEMKCDLINSKIEKMSKNVPVYAEKEFQKFPLNRYADYCRENISFCRCYIKKDFNQPLQQDDLNIIGMLRGRWKRGRGRRDNARLLYPRSRGGSGSRRRYLELVTRRRRPRQRRPVMADHKMLNHEEKPSESRGEPGSIPGRVTPGCSYVGIVPDDAAGRRTPLKNVEQVSDDNCVRLKQGGQLVGKQTFNRIEMYPLVTPASFQTEHQRAVYLKIVSACEAQTQGNHKGDSDERIKCFVIPKRKASRHTAFYGTSSFNTFRRRCSVHGQSVDTTQGGDPVGVNVRNNLNITAANSELGYAKWAKPGACKVNVESAQHNMQRRNSPPGDIVLPMNELTAKQPRRKCSLRPFLADFISVTSVTTLVIVHRPYHCITVALKLSSSAVAEAHVLASHREWGRYRRLSEKYGWPVVRNVSISRNRGKPEQECHGRDSNPSTPACE
ncbi:hypothetical protein PR048_016106 [Dryococelus australis]|uniref:Uncharacterized protein n=1 Tax=Dryococelus australis TaxID=614101 RepID=A0ABQ9HIT9_9NEOP|nr:hypothetical protein PR048_016106 [Dryococelus australis]